MKSVIIILLVFLNSITCYPQNLKSRLDSLLQGHIDNNEIHGCIAYIVQKGEVLMFKTYGYMDIENQRVMKEDAIFRIASMTKPLTAVAALKLYEEGKFLLDDPVKKYIPGFANLRVLSPDNKRTDSLITLSLQRDVTIRDLFRHTSGIGYPGDDVIGKLYDINMLSMKKLTLKEMVQAILETPLKFQPGSKWEYGYSIDVLGYLIEVISGKPLDKYMDEALFKPLDMENTGFYTGLSNLDKLCSYYYYNDNKLFLVDKGSTSQLQFKPDLISGGGGGISTAEDYGKFCQMLLNYGEYNGKQFLNKQTVELLISDQIGAIKDHPAYVEGYGLGIGVVPEKNCGHTQICYWSGSPYNTTFMIDYNKQMYAILLTQNGPWQHLNLMRKFNMIVSEETKK